MRELLEEAILHYTVVVSVTHSSQQGKNQTGVLTTQSRPSPSCTGHVMACMHARAAAALVYCMQISSIRCDPPRAQNVTK